MNKNYAMFVACTNGCNGTADYLPYLNALLNSIEKREVYKKCDLTVYVFYNGWRTPEYLKAIETVFSFKVVPMELAYNSVDLKPKEFIKRERYSAIRKLGLNHDAVCLLDVDMFFVSNQFNKLFDLVNGTTSLIGCNERYKWDTGRYYYKGEKMFPVDTKLYNMICNTPAIFDMNEWGDVFDCYCDFIHNTECREDDRVKGLGDLYLWNTAIQYCNRQDDIVCLPMDTMAQVHKTDMRDFTYPVVDGDYWRSFSGDRRYVQHGRIAQENFVSGSLEWFDKCYVGWEAASKVRPKIEAGLKKIQSEWYSLNFNCKLVLGDYVQVPEFYHKFKG